MADAKYKAGSVALTKEQMDVIERAMGKFKKTNGVTVTRSQMLAMLAHWYINQKQEK